MPPGWIVPPIERVRLDPAEVWRVWTESTTMFSPTTAHPDKQTCAFRTQKGPHADLDPGFDVQQQKPQKLNCNARQVNNLAR